MNAQMLLQSFAGGDGEKTYIDDVFSTYLYTGNGSTQTINNGIDLAGEGGLVWSKQRDGSAGWHSLIDSLRGVDKTLCSHITNGELPRTDAITSFNNNGFSLGADVDAWVNGNSKTYISWTFRRAPKFFDIVTYTGNGTSNRQIAHGLGAEPGFITMKSTSTTGNWNSYHRSATGDLVLNSTAAQTGSRAIVTAANSSTFTVSGVANTNGVQYVAYLFAHDDSEDGIIQCGSFTSTVSAQSINLGWEPQFLLVKRSSSTDNWIMVDCQRGFQVDRSVATLHLLANTSGAESSSGLFGPTATGFTHTNGTAGDTYIYLAIRRPNKPPTSGTEVYNAIARTGTGAAATVTIGFDVDAVLVSERLKEQGLGAQFIPRLADQFLDTGNENPEFSQSASPGHSISFSQESNKIGYGVDYVARANISPRTYINHLFRRAPGFFDVVCDTGTGAAHAINHSLTVAPELIIRKSRSAATQWECWHSALAATEKLVLNTTAGKATGATAFGTLPTATQFYVGASSNTNASAATYVTYLFATCPGVSKVGYYTGNGTSLPIDCGFTSGARFVLIKRTDSTGDWFIWDTARGIVAANDPHLSLNTTAAEVTADDSVDPYAGGFIVNKNTATNINISGKRYIFLAIA